MAARRRKHAYGLGGDDREMDRVESTIEQLTARLERGREALSNTARALASGSPSKAFRAKMKAQDALAAISKTLETSRITRSTSGRRLDSLPKHAPFGIAHEFVRSLDHSIERAEAMRKRLIAISYGDAQRMREGLERDRARRARRR